MSINIEITKKNAIRHIYSDTPKNVPKAHKNERYVGQKHMQNFWSVHNTTNKTMQNCQILVPYFNIYRNNIDHGGSNDMSDCTTWFHILGELIHLNYSNL